MSDYLDILINRYHGRTCTHPRGKDGQCVCLIRCYFDIVGIPQFPSVLGAQDLWNVLNRDSHFIRIENKPWVIPQKADIFVMPAWSNDIIGRYGHTGFVREGATIFTMPSFDSNWSIKNVASFERHSYTNPRVRGFFRLRKTITTFDRVNDALRECGDNPSRPVGTLNLSKWWQNRVVEDPIKFTNDDAGYNALVGAIKWHQTNHKYPHDL